MRFGNPKEAGATLEAIEDVYRRRFQAFVKVAAGVAGERQAEDAVHLGFVRALRHRRSFRGESTLDTWLWKTVLNAARDLRHTRTSFNAPEDHGFQPDTNGRPSDAETNESVRAAVANLPERQRMVLFLRYYADLDYQRIAEILNIAQGTVGATLHAAHGSLRAALEEDSRCVI